MTIPPGYDREEIARIIDPTTAMYVERWKDMPNGSFAVSSRHVRENQADWERALSKADAILSMLSKGEGIGSENASPSPLDAARHSSQATPSLLHALREAEWCLNSAAQVPFDDPDHQAAVEDLGDRIGYGALMCAASAAWRKRSITGGEFACGPCRSTAAATLALVREQIAALSRPDETPAPSAWLPIESAPRDGAWFIALENGLTYPCQWHADEPDEGPYHEGWWDHFNDSFENPTHWQPSPLPDPPQ